MKLGILGGSGLYDLSGLEDVQQRELSTPFGDPSDVFTRGLLAGHEVFFLPRHGRGHRLLPSEINNRANIMGFKMLGVGAVLSVSAVGSLREELRPRDIVLPDQYYDRTKNSQAHTFFGDGIVAHVSFADPTCAGLRRLVYSCSGDVIKKHGLDVRVHDGGTYVNMEGPAFSTRAESLSYRDRDMDVIGMTSLAEAKLCREAELCYQALAMVTDYDCWRETEEVVSVETVIAHLQANTILAREILVELVGRTEDCADCTCRSSLRNAIMTDPAVIPETTRARLAPILGDLV